MPSHADNAEVRANRIDTRVVDKDRKRVALIEMSCPWTDNRSTREAEKATKQQYPRYDVKHFNIVIDVIGGWSVDLEETTKRNAVCPLLNGSLSQLVG